MFDEEKAGRNSSGSRVTESQPRTMTPKTAMAMVTRRSTANRMIGLIFTQRWPFAGKTGLFQHEISFLPTQYVNFD